MANGEKRVIQWECPVIYPQGDELEKHIADPSVDSITFECSVEDCGFSDTYIKDPDPGVFPIQTRGGSTTKCDFGNIKKTSN